MPGRRRRSVELRFILIMFFCGRRVFCHLEQCTRVDPNEVKRCVTLSAVSSANGVEAGITIPEEMKQRRRVVDSHGRT